MRRTFTRFALLAGTALVAQASLATSVALAQDESSSIDAAQARELFNEGLKLRDKGEVAAALEKLKAAHALGNTPITGLELGRTYASSGKLVEARETFLSIARIPVRPTESARSQAARAESEKLAGQLRTRIPSLTINVTGVPSEMVAVTVDGATVPTAALAAPRPLNPGVHRVSARSTSGGTADTTVELAEGESRSVELQIAFAGGAASANAGTAAAVTEPTKHEETSSQTGRSHALEWSLIIGGAALAAAGGTLMVVEANQANTAAGRDDRSAYDSGKTLWTVSLAGTLVGAAAVAGGVILFATTGAKGPTSVSRRPIWVGVSGQGAMLGGTW